MEIKELNKRLLTLNSTQNMQKKEVFPDKGNIATILYTEETYKF